MALTPAVSGDAGKDARLQREKGNLSYERMERNGLVPGGGREISRKSFQWRQKLEHVSTCCSRGKTEDQQRPRIIIGVRSWGRPQGLDGMLRWRWDRVWGPSGSSMNILPMGA